MLQRVDSHTAGYQLVAKYLPSVDVDPETSDFLFQLNRPRKSTTLSGLKINRLAKWSVAKIQGVHLQMQGASAESGNLITGVKTSELFACRLELDINTDAGWKDTLPAESATSILGELVGLAIEIASKGDHP
jgi:hypothetical protein